jgi:hypothetical protein
MDRSIVEELQEALEHEKVFTDEFTLKDRR